MKLSINVARLSNRLRRDQRDNLHVENADDAQGTRVPLPHVPLETGLERVGELANDGNGPVVPGEMALLVPVDGLLEGEEGEDDGDGRVQPGRRPGSRG